MKMKTEIQFSIKKCFLDLILVATTQKGICAIFLGNDSDELTQELQNRFPRANLIKNDKALKETITSIIDFIKNGAKKSDFSLDLQGTPFQQRVWRALTKVPRGYTATYQEIAKKIGAPKSARAVAQACASNRVAIIIPCHRIVRTNGSLSGYRWGVARKKMLLEQEI